MNTKQFLNQLTSLSCAPTENSELLMFYFKNKMPITFFSWKLFGIQNTDNAFVFDYEFDTKEANRYIEKEKSFLKLLLKSGLPFQYIKVIPDELPSVLLQKSVPATKKLSYQNAVRNYFRTLFSKTEVYLLTDLMKQFALADLYETTFQKVLASFEKSGPGLVSSAQLNTEILARMNMYAIRRPLATSLAKRAFALFASETALLFELERQNVFPNLVLLAGNRSVNTDKYEFYKVPFGRPVLPKLFVI